jgi:uncharacterized BrkB/YihY/UPF0761 family membrane protein
MVEIIDGKSFFELSLTHKIVILSNLVLIIVLFYISYTSFQSYLDLVEEEAKINDSLNEIGLDIQPNVSIYSLIASILVSVFGAIWAFMFIYNVSKKRWKSVIFNRK